MITQALPRALVAVGFIATAPLLAAQEDPKMTEPENFRSAEEGNWYHPVDFESWAYLGADDVELVGILERIASATGARSDPDQPDTLIEYGPGNWIYEFTSAGDMAMAEGRHAAAIAYYHTAAAPHTGRPEMVSALEKAYAAHAALMKDVAIYEEVEITLDGHRFTGHLHLPAGDGPVPLVVASNGSDMSAVVTHRYFLKHLMPQGIALMTLDLPGLGRSATFDMADGASEKLHVAAIKWAQTDPRIDRRNIFAQGASFGGHATARLWALHPDLDLAGVVSVCGPLHAPFLAPPEAYAHLPRFTIDGVKTRLSLPLEASSESFAQAIRVFALPQAKGHPSDPIETPLFALTTHDDPVAPLEDLNRLLAHGVDTDKLVFHVEGHCPARRHRDPVIAAWIADRLR